MQAAPLHWTPNFGSCAAPAWLLDPCTQAGVYAAGKGLGGVWALKTGFARDRIAVVDQVPDCWLLLHLPVRRLSLSLSTWTIYRA